MYLFKHKKVALVQNSFWYAYRFRRGLMYVLQNAGAQVYVLAPASGEEGDTRARAALVSEGFHVISFQAERYTQTGLSEWAILVGLWRIYRAYRFDLCLHYTIKPNIYGAIAAYLTGTTSIAITTGLGTLKRKQHTWSGWILRRLYWVAVRLSKEVWFLNESDAAFFHSKGLAPTSKSFVLKGEGVDIAYYAPRPRGQVIPNAPLRLLFVGRLLRSKGLMELYQAALYYQRIGQPVQIELLGFPVEDHPDSIPLSIIRDWEDKGLWCYLGMAWDVRPFMARADALVLPSLGEGMSRVILEGCSMAIPVITTDVEGCRELVHEGETGFLCCPEDSISLIEAIERFRALSFIQRAQLGVEGRNRVAAQYSEGLILRAIGTRLETIFSALPASNFSTAPTAR